MKDLKELCREFVQRNSAGLDASHDISHIDRVVANAKKIYALSDSPTREMVDVNILIAISSLHDSFDHKYFTTEAAVEEAKSKVSCFLETECMQPPETIRMIIEVIEKMGYTAEMASRNGASSMSDMTRCYLNIVQDADRLDAIGAIGISRCFAFTGAFGRPIITEEGLDESQQRNALREGSLQPTAQKGPSAISHFYDKLVFLKDLLKTPAGKILGEKRHNFMLHYLDEFFDEINV